MSELNRVRWRCRRGMLELDLALARFVDRHYLQLTPGQRDRFDDLLIRPDNELWDMITQDEIPVAVDEMAFLLGLLRRC